MSEYITDKKDNSEVPKQMKKVADKKKVVAAKKGV
jgi:hypothetical protein